MTRSDRTTHDAVVIGAGPGGYVCAIRLAQLGLTTAIVERDRLGGVCLNYGCIPSKALIAAGNLYERIGKASEFGISVTGLAVDPRKLQEFRAKTVKRLTDGIAHLLKKNRVEVVFGEARFTGAGTLAVKCSDGGERTLGARRGIVVATGGAPISIPGFELDGDVVLSSTEALELAEIPRHLLVIGGGIIGLEIGTCFFKFGSQLTVVEMMDQLLPGTDPDLVAVVGRELKKRKAKVHLSSKAVRREKKSGRQLVTIETPGGTEKVECDRILLTVGRRPSVASVGLEAAGVRLDEKGYVPVDGRMQTNVPGVFAIGDCVGMPLLAHKASKEGMVAAEAIAGLPTVYDVRAMPAAIFTHPEIATVGLTAEEAAAAGRQVKVGSFPFSASGRALSTGEAEGMVKVVADASSGVLLGVGIVGHEAANLISEAALAIEMGATLEDLALTVHPHPTLSEALMEAAEVALGHPIHVAP